MKLLLASKSPRRKELLSELGWNVTIVSSHFDEVKTEEDKRIAAEPLLKAFHGADTVPVMNALGKARNAALSLSHGEWVIGADTVVVFRNQILGKPKDRNDAKTMLHLLSGNVHEVKTGVAITNGQTTRLHVETTKVWFHEMTDQEIEQYAATGECDDKAGAYAIQGKAAVFIDRIEGSYDNVVGLPRAALYHMLKKEGVLPDF